MKEIRLHGRGGQGVVLASRILAETFLFEGKYPIAFPMFGTERRGGPVAAFLRFNDQPIREKTQIYSPDCLVVTDVTMKNDPMVFSGLKTSGILVLNSTVPYRVLPHPNIRTIGIVDATGIALQEIGIAVPNTCMVGAFAKVTGWLKLESVLLSLERYFRDSGLAKNIKCAQRGYNEVRIIESEQA
jgi:2-oxoacid:acceptor oxidoreductase gamma subunit (pyruvate/2-ketoisovalerate family)